MADEDAKRSACRHCGRPVWECSDPERVFYVQRVVCRATMELTAAEDAYDELHKAAPYHDGTFAEWAAERSSEYPYHAKAGVTFYVADEDTNPDDAFTTDAGAIPVPLPSPDGLPLSVPGGTG